MDLVCILNTAENLAVSAEKESGIYVKIDEEMAAKYKKGTFRELISRLCNYDELNEDESLLADEIKNYLEEHDGINKVFYINVYDEDKSQKKNVQNEQSYNINLEEKVMIYIDKREIDTGDEVIGYECIDLVVGLNTKVGK